MKQNEWTAYRYRKIFISDLSYIEIVTRYFNGNKVSNELFLCLSDQPAVKMQEHHLIAIAGIKDKAQNIIANIPNTINQNDSSETIIV